MSLAFDETWERLSALDAVQLRASIRACGRYLRSPEGIAEFGLADKSSEAEGARKFDEAFGQSELLRREVADLMRRVEKLEAPK